MPLAESVDCHSGVEARPASHIQSECSVHRCFRGQARRELINPRPGREILELSEEQQAVRNPGDRHHDEHGRSSALRPPWATTPLPSRAPPPKAVVLGARTTEMEPRHRNPQPGTDVTLGGGCRGVHRTSTTGC